MPSVTCPSGHVVLLDAGDYPPGSLSIGNVARIKRGGKTRNLGTFATVEEALAARESALV